MTPSPHVFGVRHLSPGGAWHLLDFLDRIQPDIVLIEGLADADDLIPFMIDPRTRPPIAILAYTESTPVRTLVYPMAEYCPEFQAMRWASAHDREVRFIDLPSHIFLALQKRTESEEGDRPDEEPDAPPGPSIYEQFAARAGEPDYETCWERRFEHNLSPDSYRLAAHEFGRGLREIKEAGAPDRAENLVREAYMRRRMKEAVDEGWAPEKIVAVVGAYHAPVMNFDHPVMTDEEFASLPGIGSKRTLMPYSYFKLSSQSGYGAGNHAPLYFEMMWRCLQAGDPSKLTSEYLSRIVRFLRKSGSARSTAEVIEGVRLANTLSALKGGEAPTLLDLKDAAITLIGQGEPSVAAEAMARVEVGTAIGRLPEGVSQTSIQDDFNRELKRLKLEKHHTAVARDISLDLRENRRVKSAESAFLDLNRSSFLHRLAILGVSFAQKRPTRQSAATWAEAWTLQWTSESEIALVEAVLLGETIELAAGYRFKTRLDECETVNEAATIVRQACECGMLETMDQARRALRRLAGESSVFTAIAGAAAELGAVVRYGDVRRFDPEPLKPLIEQLFTEGALLLLNASNCDDAASKQVLNGVTELNRISLEYNEIVDEALWIDRLHKLSDADHLNPLLSGCACAILLERNLISNEDLAMEVSRRLSPGIEADLGAGWFEGLSRRNRYALLARLPLWEQLAEYIQALDDEQFSRALVFLRRALGDFSPDEKRHIAENLGEVWGVNPDDVSDIMNRDLTEEEEQNLDDLDDFDFDDL